MVNVAKKYPNLKTILQFASVGALIAGTLIFPQMPILLKGRSFDFEDFFPEEEWDQFDESRLRQRLKELHRRKVIRIYQVGDKYAVQITKAGQRKLLQYKLDDLEIPKPARWDGRWRIVAYDIPKEKKAASNAMRETLKNLGLLQLQKSVYLYPYPCSDAIEFLREIYGIGEYVTLLTVGYLENSEAYEEHFELN